MNNHTPAPWTAQKDCRSAKNNGIFYGKNKDNAWGIYGNGHRIAVLEEASPVFDQDTVNVNACLIAAAPALLDALEEISTCKTSSESTYRPPEFYESAFDVIVNIARAAIAQAKEG